MKTIQNILKYFFTTSSLLMVLVILSSGDDNYFNDFYLVLKSSDELLIDFAEKVSLLIEKIFVNSKESQTLGSLRDFLLPMLMNGQVVVE